jgi:hypothetical protein
MSLSRIALRIAAVEAIRGRTLVGDNVLDSPNGALDIQADGSLRTAQEKPFVSVFTDLSKKEAPEVRSLIENGACDIVFEIGVSTAMNERDKRTGESFIVGVDIPPSDRNREFYLDIVQRQIFDALNDPANAWADIYRGLHYRILKVEFVGARSTEDGQKLTGHQVRVTVELADDPLRGEEIDAQSPFGRFLSAIEASDDSTYQDQAALIRTLLTGASQEWTSFQRHIGLTNAELVAVGHGPLEADPAGATPPLASVTIEMAKAVPVKVTPDVQ